MNNNQPNAWCNLGFMLALTFILGLSVYLPLTVVAAQPKFTLPANRAKGQSQLTMIIPTLGYTVYLPIIFKRPDLVDNFDDGQDPNALGGYSNFAWGPVPCPQTISGNYTMLNPYNGSYSYRLSFNATPICYGVWQTDLRDLNFSGSSAITFWIRGASGSERPHIYLQDSDNCQLTNCRYFVDVNSFLTAGRVTTGWQQARIPLTVFTANGVNLTRLRFFQVVFEWDNLAGTIYIDEIRFQ